MGQATRPMLVSASPSGVPDSSPSSLRQPSSGLCSGQTSSVLTTDGSSPQSPASHSSPSKQPFGRWDEEPVSPSGRSLNESSSLLWCQASCSPSFCGDARDRKEESEIRPEVLRTESSPLLPVPNADSGSEERSSDSAGLPVREVREPAATTRAQPVGTTQPPRPGAGHKWIAGPKGAVCAKCAVTLYIAGGWPTHEARLPCPRGKE